MVNIERSFATQRARPWLLWCAGVAVCLWIGLCGSALAISDRVIHDQFSGVAIGGYDPVAYFTDHAAVQGKKALEVALDGSYWRFANEGNMQAFQQFPVIYAPAYGGYGAGSIAAGRLAPGNPLIWLIAHNRLFFFFSEAERVQWLTNPEGFEREADVRWKGIVRTLSPD